jgi:hypothetical protein
MPDSTVSTDRPQGRTDHRGHLLGPCTARTTASLAIGALLILARSKNLRIDALFAIERLAQQQRMGVRTERSRPLVVALESWFREQRIRVSTSSDRQGYRLQSQAMD